MGNEFLSFIDSEVSLTQDLFCMCVYVNGATDSVLYKRGVLVSGVSFKRGATVLLTDAELSVYSLAPLHQMFLRDCMTVHCVHNQ